MPEPLLKVENVSKTFSNVNNWFGTAPVRVLTDINFSLLPGAILGVVGESGCGKSTLARVILGLLKPDVGTVLFKGQDISLLNRRQKKTLRCRLQVIFQNAYDSLDPKMRIRDLLLEGMTEHGICDSRSTRLERLSALVAECGLPDDCMNRYPADFSGGQLQRINIVRALSLNPELLVADEILSSLDIPAQAKVMEMLSRQQQVNQLALIFISHDLSVVRHFCDDILVMNEGRIIERCSAASLTERSGHPYTQRLLDASPAFPYRD